MRLIDPRGPLQDSPQLDLAPRRVWAQLAEVRVGLLENGGGGISVSTRDMGLALEAEFGCDVHFARKPSRSREAPADMIAALDDCAGVICAVAE